MRIEDPDVPGDWWASGLAGSKALYEFFGRRPVSLEGAMCTKMHFEPFPRALWTIIELSDVPDPIPRNWSDWGYDAVCLRMGFLACRDVRAEGTLPITGCSVALTREYAPAPAVERLRARTYKHNSVGVMVSILHPRRPLDRRLSAPLVKARLRQPPSASARAGCAWFCAVADPPTHPEAGGRLYSPRFPGSPPTHAPGLER